MPSYIVYLNRIFIKKNLHLNRSLIKRKEGNMLAGI